MPTLAVARNSPAPTSTAMTTITSNSSSSSNADAATVATTAMTMPTTTVAGTTNAHNVNSHHYHHPPPVSPAHFAANINATATTVTTSATATLTTSGSVATSLATFNGNANLNVANGNMSKVAGSGGGGVAGNNNIAAKKPLSTHTSREDVTSLGGAVSINSQLSGATNNHNNNNNNNNASSSNSSSNNSSHSSSNGSHGNNNSGNSNGGGGGGDGIIKGSKENLLQNYYNGIGSSSSDSGAGGMATHTFENDDPGDGLGPLPPKWETAYTERGELYFIDHNTGTSHWLDPRLSKFQKKSLEDCSDDELPYGWEKIEDSLYGTYYIDHVNRRTQYENPVLEAKRRAAEQKQKQQQPPPPIQQSQQPPSSTQQRAQTPSIMLNGSVITSGAAGSRTGIAAPSSGSVSASNVLDISQRGMQPPPPGVTALKSPPAAHLPYKFTRNPAEMQGERISTTLLKSSRGLGITIVGGDDGVEEFLQIKSIVPNGPAWMDGQLQTGDVLVYVNDTCVLGFTHHEMVNIFQSILPGEAVTLEVCRGYPLPFDPNDPNTEVVTTIAVDGLSAATDKQRRMLLDLHMDGNYNFLDVSGDSMGKGTGSHAHVRGLQSPANTVGGLNDGFILMKKPEQVHTFAIVKGAMGFGFTIADSAYGQKVKKILDRNCCTQLQEGDVLLEINNVNVRQKSHLEVVQLLKDCSKTEPTIVKIQRGVASSLSPSGVNYVGNAAVASANGASNVAKLRKNFIGNTVLFRSKTPTADLYSTQQKEILPIRPKTPLVDTRRARVKTPNNELQQQDDEVAAATVANGSSGDSGTLADSKTQVDGHHKSTSSLQEMDALNPDIPFMDPYPKLVTSLSERLAEATLLSDTAGASGTNSGVGTSTYQHGSLAVSSAANALGMRGAAHYEQQEYVTAGAHGLGLGGGNYNPIYGMSPLPPSMSSLYPHATPPQHLQHYGIAANGGSAGYSPSTPLSLMAPPSPHNMLHPHHQHATHAQYSPGTLHGTTPLQAAHIQNERMQRRVNELLSDRRRVGFSTLDAQHHQQQQQQQQQQQHQTQQQHQQQLSAQHNHMLSGIGYQQQQQQQQTHLQHSPAVSSISQQAPINAHWLAAGGMGSGYNTLQPAAVSNLPYLQRNGLDAIDADGEQYELNEVTLERQALGFGFRIVGGTEEGSQVTVGHIVPGGAADNDHRINTGDEILSIDGINVVNSSHHKVVSLMGEAALRGQVTMILRRRVHGSHSQTTAALAMPLRSAQRYPYDVIVTRHEAEGFGFVIISSSNQYYGSTIGKLIPGSPADRCGELKVGDRIIAVNRIDIAGMSHGDVVNLIKESGLHVRLTIGAPKELGSAVGTAYVGNPLLINAAQASPGQLSQSQQLMQMQQSPTIAPVLLTPTQQQQQQQQQQQSQKPHLSPLLSTDANSSYFERPSTSVSAAASGQQHQQLSQQQQPTPQL